MNTREYNMTVSFVLVSKDQEGQFLAFVAGLPGVEVEGEMHTQPLNTRTLAWFKVKCDSFDTKTLEKVLKKGVGFSVDVFEDNYEQTGNHHGHMPTE